MATRGTRGTGTTSPTKRTTNASSIPPDADPKLVEIWKTYDFNGNGFLSLAECDRAVLMLMPQYGKNKHALMRAYKAADISHDGYVQFNEFATLIDLLEKYNQMWNQFQEMDKDDDERIDFSEFVAGCSHLGITGDQATLKREFDSMDSNRGGKVLFDEFCMYLAKKQGLAYSPVQSSPPAHAVSPVKSRSTYANTSTTTSSPTRTSGKAMSPSRNASTSIFPTATVSPFTTTTQAAYASPNTSPVKTRSMQPQADTTSTATTPIKAPVIDTLQVQKVWEAFDSNGNGICSLAEIDRAITTVLPQFSKNRAAIMRAYKAADTSNDGFIQQNEFQQMIKLLAYFDTLSKQFRQLDTDNDNRVTFDEFKKGWAAISGSAVSAMDELALRKEFDKMDSNRGGYVLFDEFCFYMSQRAMSSPNKPADVDAQTLSLASQSHPPARRAMYRPPAASQVFTQTSGQSHFTTTYRQNFHNGKS
ncbi:Flagellar calcium-binding protein TB-44A [Pelomyxa schiedti]|nr:Flagellar calcium-binding protein TB-44A [Pelomyxa schiedti]